MAVDAADVIAPRLGIAPELRILEINAVAAVQVIELAIIHAPGSATAVSKSTVPKHRVHRCTNCQAASREPSLACPARFAQDTGFSCRKQLYRMLLFIHTVQ
jgi:hypothetical protein